MAAATAWGFAARPSASATPEVAYGCFGSEIYTYNIKDTAGSVQGTIHLYHSSTNGGTLRERRQEVLRAERVRGPGQPEQDERALRHS
ncbi:hypothetical protein ACFWD7_48345 [Streptomyces mirabilis]|uniref:hypothetical protein n=1 Tax=Streptomyces mirabilis TaxID=68239 RepID=UPI0036AD3BCF